MEHPYLMPIPAKTTPKFISDDDLCATCKHCQYKPGELSSCDVSYPGLVDPDGYVQECDQFDDVALGTGECTPLSLSEKHGNHE